MNKKIMIIDDNKEFLEEIVETLTLSGYEAVAVHDETKAVSSVMKEKPDVILLDLKMPKKTGFMVAAELRCLPEFSEIPIIAITGFFKDYCAPLVNTFGIQRFIKKPFNPLDVISRIEEVLKENV